MSLFSIGRIPPLMHVELIQDLPPSGGGLGIVSPEGTNEPAIEEDGAHWVISQSRKGTDRSLERFSWGFIHHWSRTPDWQRLPKTIGAEGVASSPRFGDAYRRRWCLVPVRE